MITEKTEAELYQYLRAEFEKTTHVSAEIHSPFI